MNILRSIRRNIGYQLDKPREERSINELVFNISYDIWQINYDNQVK